MTPDEATRATLVDDEAAAPDDSEGDPLPGDRIGRYVLLHRVGAGGMGVVFAARDPELDRDVALKVLRTSQRDRGPTGRARFVREAQAMAMLTHPNVVQIYDVGTSDDLVFIAMELVDGVTLKCWLEASRRPWREIVRTFVAAGRGLAAAHEQGIVHRDFKPDNVLLSVEAQSVVGIRVVDFGLARGTETMDSQWSREPDEIRIAPAEEELARPLGHTQLTNDGTVMGTPGYMAPEQHRGRSVDARTDQYAFCVALWEALFGARPFPGRSLSELLRAKERCLLPLEREGEIPRPVRDALVRGLSPTPDGRWPGMHALLERLESVLSSPVRWPYAAAATMIGAAIVIAAQPWAPSVAGCEDPQQRVAAVWNDEQRARASAAFESFAFASEAWPRTEAALDEYAASWIATYRSVCNTSRDQALDKQMRCMTDRLDALATVAGVLAEADTEAVHRAVAVTTALPSPQTCAREEVDEELPAPPEPERAARAIDIERRLNRALLLDEMGRYRAAAEVAEAAHASAAELGWPPLQADAAVVLGGVLEGAGEYRRAAALLEEGVLAAVGLGLDRVALRGVAQIVFLVGFRLNDLARAERWARQGLAMLTRLGEDGGATEARLLNAYGALWDAMGDYATSRAYFERARELFETAYGPEHPSVATARQNVGIELTRLGDYEAAREELSRALTLYRKTSGSSHPETANALDNLGAALQRLGRHAEAEAVIRDALTIRRLLLGEEHADVARSYTNLGAIEEALGDFVAAERHYARAAEIFVKVMGEENATTAAAQVNHAQALERAGDPKRALEMLRSATVRMQSMMPPDHPHLAFAHLALARTHLALQEPTVALDHADQAIAMCRTTAVEPILCALAKFARARAMWADETHRDAALREAEAAREELRAAGDTTSADLREIDEWLRTR